MLNKYNCYVLKYLCYIKKKSMKVVSQFSLKITNPFQFKLIFKTIEIFMHFFINNIMQKKKYIYNV